jgi:hypothetical protein
MRLPLRAITFRALAASLGLGLGALACVACDRHAEPTGSARPGDTGAAGAAGAASTTASAASTSAAASAFLSRHPRDDAGHLIPRMAPPPPDPSASSQAGRDPDWDLDQDDPARDYVRRYVAVTKRYGETLDCISLEPSQPSGEKRRVEAKNAPGCPAAGQQRDVFVVDVAADRLSVDDRTKRDVLARWPDGSDPEGPANPVRDGSQMKAWQGPLKDAIRMQELVPVRVQAYGRGSYPVVTIAGWHKAVTPSAPPESLRPFAEALCRANEGLPLAFLAGVNRSTLMRVRCPGGVRWETL